jgi:flagellar M-ring protein FliF
MTFGDVRSFGQTWLERCKPRPRPAVAAAGAVALAVLIYAALSMAGPPYAPLFDGLSAARGGAVIAQLQKLGISYRLSQNGSIIEVPARDLGRARLELGEHGMPGTSGSSALGSLEKVSMTTSTAAVDALRLQVIEDRLQQAIQAISGARKVKVLLAVPRYTPFLADQPNPRASVVLISAQEPDQGLGKAVAKLVAGSVSGLAAKDVVVETGRGAILFPTSSTQSAESQFAIQDRIESTQEAKLRSLLTPIFGAGNYRLAVAASVSFSNKIVKSLQYGPKSFQISSDKVQSSKVGNSFAPIGIPGALSNQPPGPTTAPVPAPPTNPTGTAKPKSPSSAQLPRSSSTHSKSAFAIDTTSTVDRPAGWHIQAMKVSIVINSAALGTTTTKKIQGLVAGTIAVPGGAVVVTTAPFVTPGAPAALPQRPKLTLIIRAVLTVLAALALLLGIFLPMMRWLSRFVIRTPAPIETEAKADSVPLFEKVNSTTILQDHLRQAIVRVANVTETQPAALARTLQRWALDGTVRPSSDGSKE